MIYIGERSLDEAECEGRWGRVLTKRWLEISVLHAVRVCLLGFVQYSKRLPRHGRE